jgi:hypothetical protein
VTPDGRALLSDLIVEGVSLRPGGAIDLSDLDDPRAIALLSVPPVSTVVMVGLDAAVACSLAGRGCRVYGLGARAAAVEAAAPWCDQLLVEDPCHADVETWLDREKVDAVLWQETSEAPAETESLRRLIAVLAPGGRLITSHPVAALLRSAGWRIVEEIQAACAVVLIAQPGEDVLLETFPSLAGAAINRLRERDAECHRLQQAARKLRDEVQSLTLERSSLQSALEEARVWQRRSVEDIGPLREQLRVCEEETTRLREQSAAATDELVQCRVERRFLRDDVVVKDAYIATLREATARLEHAAERQRDDSQSVAEERRLAAEAQQSLNERLNQAAAAESAALARASELERSNDALRRELDAARVELHRVHTAIAATLAQPRYVVADRLNAWAKKLSLLHAPLKRAFAARRR